MALTTKNFTTLVQEWAAIFQTQISVTFPAISANFTKGSILRSFAEAQSSVGLWLQGLILQLLTVTRLSTSQGEDVDTFVNDFDMTRLPGTASTGPVTFSRNVPTYPAVIPVGATVQTFDGSQTFSVYADPTNAAYSATANNGAPGYIVPAQVFSLNVPVQNTAVGAAGNVQAGSISLLQTGISGIDSVTNAGAFTNGFNQESDAAVKSRFVLYINSLSKGTEGAIGYAIQSVQQGLQYQILEMPPPAPGLPPAVSVWVDDGSGAIPAATLAAASSAVNAVRAAGVSVGVYPATALIANINMTIISASGFQHPTVIAEVTAAIASYINGLGLQQTPQLSTLYYAAVSAVAMGVPGVLGVSAYTLNNVVADLIPANGQTIKAGVISIA